MLPKFLPEISQASSLAEIKEILKNTTVSLGHFGGRYYSDQNSPADSFLSLREVIQKVNKLIEKEPIEFFDIENVAEIKTLIASLDDSGEKALAAGTTLQKLGTVIKRTIGNRDRPSISRGLQHLEEIAAKKQREFTETACNTIRNMKDVQSYEELCETAWRKNGTKFLTSLPLPTGMGIDSKIKPVCITSRTRALEVLSRTGSSWNENHYLRQEDVMSILVAWHDRLSKKEDPQKANEVESIINLLLLNPPTDIQQLADTLSVSANDTDHVGVIRRKMQALLGQDFAKENILVQQQLLETWDKSEGSKDFLDRASLQWIHDVAISLQEKIEKINTPDDPELKATSQFLLRLHAKITQLESEAKKMSIPSPDIFEVEAAGFSNVVQPHSILDISRVQVQEGKVGASSIASKQLEPLDFNNLPETAKNVDAWIEYIDTLTLGEEFGRVDKAAGEFFQQFATEEARLQCIQNIPQDHIGLWTQRLEKISSAMVQANLALGRRGLPHTRIAMLLRNIDMLQSLLKRDPTALFDKYKFDLEFLPVVLKDPYLDLGTSGPEIHDLLQKIHNTPGELAQFASPSPYQGACRYLQQFQGKALSESFTSAQNAIMMLHLAMFRHYMLTDTVKSPFSRATRQQYVEDQERIQKKLMSCRGQIKFVPQTSGNCFMVEPFGLHMHPLYNVISYNDMYSDVTSGAISLYRQQHLPVKSREIRKRIIEGVVAVGDAGAGETGDVANYREFRYQGSHSTQNTIQDEMLDQATIGSCSPGLFKKLELMQTAPDDRVRNTILLFASHPHLLNETDWQRVFQLNLFRSSYLYQKLVKDPGCINELLEHLQILAEHSQKDGTPPQGFMIETIATILSIVQAVPNIQLPPSYSAVQELQKTLISTVHECLSQNEKEIVNEHASISPLYQNECRDWLTTICRSQPTNISDEQLVAFFKRYMILREFPRAEHHEESLVEIEDTVGRLLPRMATLIETNPTIMNTVVELTWKTDLSTKWKQETVSPSVWSSGNKRVDLKEGLTYIVSKEKVPLPARVLDAIGNILSASAARTLYPSTTCSIEGEKYKKIEVLENHQSYMIFFRPQPSKDPPIIQRQRDDGNWEQLWESPFLPQVGVPRCIQELQCWRSTEDNTVRFFDEHGQMQASALLQGTSLCQLKISGFKGTHEMKSFHETDTSLLPFRRIAGERDVIALGPEGENSASKIFYPDFGLEYDWDSTSTTWTSPQHPGFHLSNRDIEEFTTPLAQENQEFQIVARLFSASFLDYHILEKSSGTPSQKLILSGQEYTQISVRQAGKMGKHVRPVRERKGIADLSVAPLYTFELDKEKGILSFQPEGYLYLAYVLYVQGKYQQASLAIRQACMRMQGLSEDAKRIIGFFDTWSTDDPNALAVRALLALHETEQDQMEHVESSHAVQMEESITERLEIFKKYRDQKSRIDPQFLLTPNEEEKFLFLGRRSLTWVNGHLYKTIAHMEEWRLLLMDSHLSSLLMKNDNIESIQHSLKEALKEHLEQLRNREKPDPDEIARFEDLLNNYEAEFEKLRMTLKGCFVDFKDLGFYAKNGFLSNLYWDNPLGARVFITPLEQQKKTEKLLRYGLDREIEIRETRLSEHIQQDRTDIQPILQQKSIFEDYSVYFEQSSPNVELKEKINRYIAEMETVFQDKESYEYEMMQEVIDDLKKYCLSLGTPLEDETVHPDATTRYMGILDKTSLPQLQADLLEQKANIERNVNNAKKQLVDQFMLGSRSSNTLRLLKEQDPILIDLFEEGRWCFGQDTWTPLIEKGVLRKEQINTVQALYREYLESNTILHQYEKALAQIQIVEQQTGEDKTEEELLIKILQQKRCYNTGGPLASAILLREDELGIICDENQVRHFFDMVQHQSSFKHEAWGGGKTSVQRHLITKFHADGWSLSSLLTHAPLIEEHHQQLKEGTASTYGQQSYLTKFSRSSPTDATFLRREYLKLLKTVEEHGRTDQTMNSFISLRHAYTLQTLQFHETDDKEQVENDFDELRTFGKMLDFRKKRMVLGSDELDQLFSPDHQYNYSTGSPIQLEKAVYTPALDIMRLITQDKKYQPFIEAFTVGNGADLTQTQRTELLDLLKKDLIRIYKFQSLEDSLNLYWNASIDVKKQYDQLLELHKQLAEHPQKDLIQSIRIFLTSIIPVSFDVKVGVTCERSSDGIHTKPAENNGQASEKSQYSSVFTMAWYTCLDYLRERIHEKGLVPAIKTYVGRLQEIAADQQRSSGAPSLNATQVGQKFLKNFGISLSEVREDSYASIAEKINNDILLLTDFMEIANFTTATIYSRRLVGNGKQVGRDVAQIWGSSGNSERVRTLPKKVKRHSDLIQQKGTRGRILYNLLKDYEPNDELVLGQRESLAQLVSTHMKPGSMCVDAAALFQGMTPEGIISDIQHVSEDKQPWRYIGSDGVVRIRQSDGSEEPDDGTIPIDACRNFLSHADRRGRNLLLPATCTNLMTISSDMTFTDFSQGGMRARGWGRGQKYKPILDEAFLLKNRERGRDQLSFPAQLFATTIENEVRKLKSLHTMSTREEIVSIGESAAQDCLRGCTNLTSFQEMKKICTASNYLDQSAETNLDALSKPKVPIDTLDEFTSLVSSEKERLKKFQTLLEQSQHFPDDEKNQYRTIIQNALQDFDDDIVLDKKYYVPEILSSLDQLGTETVESEEVISVEQVQENITVDEVLDEVELELDIEQEQEMNVEEERVEPRLSSRIVLRPTILPQPQDLQRDKKLIRLTFPSTNIHVTQICTSGDYGLWCRGSIERQQLLAPSVLLVWNNQDITAVMGTAKDADGSFETYKSQLGFKTFHYKLFDQRPVEDILRGMPDNVREKARQQIAFAKLMYGIGVQFDEQEKQIIKGWQRVNPVQAEQLQNYLRRHFSENDSRAVLDILSSD